MQGFAEARGHMFASRLDRMSDSVAGQTVVDPKGYLTDMNSIKVGRRCASSVIVAFVITRYAGTLCVSA